MEKFAAGFAVLGALLVLATNVSMSEAQAENKYFKAGGELRLSPVPVSEKIYSIVWKYDKNLLAEWVKGSIDLTYYSKFKGRSALNTVTGELVVQNMTSGDKGVYSVEINNKVQSQVYQTVEIQEVPKPTVEVQPLACSPDSEKCRLICAGEIAQAGPVTYSWKKDGGEWERSENNIMEIFNNKDTWPVKTFSCNMTNPVSGKDSDPISNKFYKNPDDTPSGGGNVAIIATVIVVTLVLIPVVVCILYKRKLLCFKKHGDMTPVSTKDPGMTEQPSPSNANGEAGESA